MKWVQKVVVNGRSAGMNFPRKLMFFLNLRPGDMVEITYEEGAESCSVRSWVNRDAIASRSPGEMPSSPPVRS